MCMEDKGFAKYDVRGWFTGLQKPERRLTALRAALELDVSQELKNVLQQLVEEELVRARVAELFPKKPANKKKKVQYVMGSSSDED